MAALLRQYQILFTDVFDFKFCIGVSSINAFRNCCLKLLFLSDRGNIFSVVNNNENESTRVWLRNGVKPGRSLVPLLFAAYVGDNSEIG
jgi:hypothetical protein